MAAQQSGMGNQSQGGPGGLLDPVLPPEGANYGPPTSNQPPPTNQPPSFGPPPPVTGYGSSYAQLPAMPGMGNQVAAPTFQAPTVQDRVVEGPQIDYSQFGPYTQQVEDEQLVSKQLEGLLASDSPYMRQAALAGQRMAAQRGALSSSIAAGASQASAIQAAFPIAAADAQNYQRVASENAVAINNNNLAKLQSTTNMAVSKLQSLTSLAATSMDVESRGKIAALNANAQSAITQMQIQAQKEAQIFEAAHQRSMEFLAQEGRMDLADAQNQYALGQIGYQGTIQSYLLDQEYKSKAVLDYNNAIGEIVASIGMSGMDSSQMIAAIQNAIAAYTAAQSMTFGGGGGG